MSHHPSPSAARVARVRDSSMADYKAGWWEGETAGHVLKTYLVWLIAKIKKLDEERKKKNTRKRKRKIKEWSTKRTLKEMDLWVAYVTVLKRSCGHGSHLPGPITEVTSTPWPWEIEVWWEFGQKQGGSWVETSARLFQIQFHSAMQKWRESQRRQGPSDIVGGLFPAEWTFLYQIFDKNTTFGKFLPCDILL